MYLSQQERELFFKLYFDLLYCVNKKRKIVKSFCDSRYPKSVDTQAAYQIREKLFDNPDWIDEYINEYGSDFSQEERDILFSWREHFIKDSFIVMRYHAKYSVLMNAGDERNTRLYGVTGINHPFADLFDKSQLPVMIRAVIIPFRNKIIYDGIVTSHNIRIGPNMRNSFNAQYNNAKEQYGIIEYLPFDIKTVRQTKTARTKQVITRSSNDLYDAIAPIIREFCLNHLNEEYADVSLQMLKKLSRKRPSPLLKGKPNTWACGIVYTVGSVNFLFDKSQSPHIRASELAGHFNLSKSTAGNKAGEISKILKISTFDREWTLPSKIGDNPFIWMFEDERGFIFDARNAPREVQEKLYNTGMIPYIPADRVIEKPQDDEVREITDPVIKASPTMKKPSTPLEGQISFGETYITDGEER